jgi:hypothetical protein
MGESSEMADAMEFEGQLAGLHGDELSRFIARALYNHCREQSTLNDKVTALESRSNKFAGMVGGVSGVIGATIVAVINSISNAK